MERLQNTHPDKDINQENAGDIEAANSKNSRTYFSHAKKKRDSQKQNGKSARVNTINQCRGDYQRQKQFAAV